MATPGATEACGTADRTTAVCRTSSRLDATDRWVLAGLIVTALLLRVVMLGRSDLWSDEVHTLRTMQMPVGDVVGERLGAGHVPLYFLLLRGWTEVAGLSQTAIRLPSALAGTVLLVPAFLLFRRLLPAAPAAARWATALVAVHPVFVELSREARMYSLLGLAFVVLAEAAVASLDDGRVRVRFWIAAALGPCVHPSWAFAVAPLAAWIAWERHCAGRRRDGGAGEDRASAGRGESGDGGAAAEAGESGECGGGGASGASGATGEGGAFGDGDAARRAGSRLLLGLLASVVLLVALLAAATPQHQVLTRRRWPAEIAVFVLRPYLTSRPADWFPTAGLALIAWIAALGVGWRASDRRARAFGAAMLVGVPVASAASGLIGGVPWGPARYVHVAALGSIAIAAAAGTGGSGTGRGSGEAATGSGTGSGGAGAGAGDGDAAVGVRAFVRIVGAAARCFLVAALFLLTLMVVGRAETAWSDAAASVRRDVPAGETVWVDDEGARLVLLHYLGGGAGAGADAEGAVGVEAPGGSVDRAVGAGDRPGGAGRRDVRVGSPATAGPCWRAHVVTDELGSVVEVERVR